MHLMRLFTSRFSQRVGIRAAFFLVMLFSLLLFAGIALADCSDSDGLDFEKRGEVTLGNGSVYPDACAGQRAVAESFCENGDVFITTVLCSEFGDDYHCVEGRCHYVRPDVAPGEVNPLFGLVLLSALAGLIVLFALYLYLWWERKQEANETHPQLEGITFLQKQLLALLYKEKGGVPYNALPDMLGGERPPIKHAVDDLYHKKIIAYVKRGRNIQLFIEQGMQAHVERYLHS